MDDRNVPMEVFDDVRNEVTSLDIALALLFGFTGNALITGLYLLWCQRNKGILIREGK